MLAVSNGRQAGRGGLLHQGTQTLVTSLVVLLLLSCPGGSVNRNGTDGQERGRGFGDKSKCVWGRFFLVSASWRSLDSGWRGRV